MNRRTAVLMLGSLAMPAWAQDSTRNALSDAKPGEVRLFVSNAILQSVTDVQPELEATLNRKLVLQAGESREMQVEILAGQPFELALMIAPVIDAMIAKGKIVPGSRVDLGLERIGIGARGDVPALDIKSAPGLRAMLQGAARISRVYGVGASVETTEKLFDRLGIGNSLDAKIIRRGGGHKPEPPPLQPGQYELYIETNRLITQMKGWTDLGLLPEEYQSPVVLAAGIGVDGDKAVAAKLIAFFKSARFDKPLSDYDITRR